MSDNLPPPPPHRPPSGPPSGPPAGPPPGPPEYLDQGGAGAPSGDSGRGWSGRRKAVVAGGAVVGLAAAGALAWGAMWYFGTGPQPAEALPDSTIAYVSLDIDPSGKQLLEARETLEKFPLWNEQEISGHDDLRAAIFEEILAEAPCDLSYDDDVEPWLGDRAAVAAVDLGGDEPSPVGVVQVKDADAAEQAFEEARECAGGSETGGWAISGEWAVVAETEEIAQEVAEEAEDSPLSGDEDFEKWTGEAGDPGILTAYAAPEAGPWLAGNAELLMGLGAVDECIAIPAPGDTDDPFADCMEDQVPEEVLSAFEDFGGAALTVRFDDGGLALETAADTEAFGVGDLGASDDADDAITSLPEDTAAAVGFGFTEGWFDQVLTQILGFEGIDGDPEGFVQMLEGMSGLEFPEDIETLAGESLSVSLGSDFELEAFLNAENSLDELPVAAKVKGDPDAIQDALDRLVDSEATGPEDEALLESDSEGGYVAVGPDGDYREKVLDDGDLGDSEPFEKVVADEAAAMLYVNFDAGGGWLEDVVGDNEVGDNVAPLAAAGLSAWLDDGVAHAVLRITTEE